LDDRIDDSHAEADAGGRKPFLLRLPTELHRELKRWAARELRSLNGQIEFVLRDAVRRQSARESECDPDLPPPPTDDG